MLAVQDYISHKTRSKLIARLLLFSFVLLYCFNVVIKDLDAYASYMPTWSSSNGIKLEGLISMFFYNILLGLRWRLLSTFNKLIFGVLFNIILAHSSLTNDLVFSEFWVFLSSLMMVSLVKPFRLDFGGRIKFIIRLWFLFLLSCLILVLINGHFAFISPLDTVNLYGFREDNGYENGALLGRILAFLAYSGVPLLLFKARLNDNRQWLLLGVLLVFMLYFATLNRVYLMSLLFLALSYRVLRKLIVGLFFFSALLPFKLLLPVKYGLWSRLLFTPSETIYWYKKFAEYSSKDYSLFSSNRADLAFDVAIFATNEKFSFNGGYLAVEGIMYGGFVSMFILIVLTSSIFQNLDFKANTFKSLILLGMPLMALMNTSFFTSLITGGLFFLFLYKNLIDLNESTV